MSFARDAAYSSAFFEAAEKSVGTRIVLIISEFGLFLLAFECTETVYL